MIQRYSLVTLDDGNRMNSFERFHRRPDWRRSAHRQTLHSSLKKFDTASCQSAIISYRRCQLPNGQSALLTPVNKNLQVPAPTYTMMNNETT